MRTFALCLALLAVVFSTHATAQNHVNGYAAATTSGRVYLIDGVGTTSTVQAGSSTGYGLVMDRSNTLLILVDYSGSLVKIDPQAKAVVGTLATGLASPRDIAVGADGDYYVIDGSGRLWKVDAVGGVTTVSSAVGGSTYGGMDVDIDTGDLLVQSATGTDPLIRVARDGSTITTLGTGFDARYGITQHIPTGDVFSGSCCGDQSPPENVFVLRAGQSTATVWWSANLAPVGVYSLKADRASAANQRLILGSLGSTVARGQGVYRIDMATQAVTQVTTITTSIYETEILYRRNIFSVSQGKGVWDIGILVPEDAGAPYVLGVSATGVRPGLPLNDGRRINLTPDTLTVVGLTTGLAPFLTGTAGNLNAKGLGAARLDLSLLGPAANGVLLYFEVLTLDPRAPNGIKTITDPHVIEVEGL